MGALGNGDKLPVVGAFTCLAGRYSVPGYDCISEALVLKDGGGAVAVWAPTGMSVNDWATHLDKDLLRARFEDGETVLGDMILQSQEDFGVHGFDIFMLRIYTLLGDPALVVK